MDDTTTGLWSFTTETGSLYKLDMDKRTLTRFPEANELRRDREALHIFTLLSCSVGARAEFLVEVRNDAVTYRQTSPVVSLRRVRNTADAIQ